MVETIQLLVGDYVFWAEIMEDKIFPHSDIPFSEEKLVGSTKMGSPLPRILIFLTVLDNIVHIMKSTVLLWLLFFNRFKSFNATNRDARIVENIYIAEAG